MKVVDKEPNQDEQVVANMHRTYGQEAILHPSNNCVGICSVMAKGQKSHNGTPRFPNPKKSVTTYT